MKIPQHNNNQYLILNVILKKAKDFIVIKVNWNVVLLFYCCDFFSVKMFY